ncbi:MAG: phosphatidate cytidylyltransferase [Bacteroidaceae bacterium]|nr:phosphatidate cytidylyltransferase [Bacteroidaceae bacterium]
MALSLKSLAIRTVTGAVFVAVIVCSILCNEYTFALVFAAFAALASAEFYRLVDDLTHAPRGTLFVDIMGSILLFITFYIYATKDFDASSIITVPYLVYFLVRFIMQLYDKVERPLEGWAYSFLGQIYVALPFAMCNVLYFRFSPIILLSLFVFIWVNDSGAYLVGCTIGRHRLYERISPKKSWEGFWGGLVLAACVAYVASLYLDILNTWQWIGLALTCSIFGTWGDLCESLIKRSLDVKDSGKSLPGHGGWLDRFDSVLLAVPASILYLFIAMAIA